MLRHCLRFRTCAIGALIVFMASAGPSSAQSPSAESTRKPQSALTAEQLSAFVKAHKGPVLDVRDAADCDAQVALPNTSHRLTFKWPTVDEKLTDPTAHVALNASFVSDLRRYRTFVQANRNQTPVLVVCCGGVRSQAAAEVLARNGFNVVTLNGGVKALAPSQTVSR